MVQRSGRAPRRGARTRGLAALGVGFAAGLLAGLGLAGSALPKEQPQWSDAATLDGPRTYAQAALVANGRILIEGGLDRDAAGVVRTRSELFDPRTGRATPLDTPDGGRLWQSLTVLPNDLVISVGGVSRGQNGGWTTQAVATAFDPWSSGYVRISQPVNARSDHGATVLHDGRLLVVGGHDGPRFIRAVEVYDPRSDRWSLVAPLPRGRSQFAIATLPDGRVLVAGGFDEPGLPTDTSFLFDPTQNVWREGPLLIVARALGSAVQLPNGDVLLAGGQRAAAGTAERYDARAGIFVFAGSLAAPRMYAQAALQEDGSVVLVGGFLRPDSGDGFVPTALAERWDPRTATWSAGPPARAGRAAGSAITAAGGTWLIGGSTLDDRALGTIELLR
ncbi:MAG: kelch-like protein [Chloroflexi bacterium]|nr:kelch-like protein [Chloroflexota bacterium]